MPSIRTCAITLMCAGLALPAAAQTKTESECLDIVSKHLDVLTGTLKEAKPTGACALANWAKNRHEEILRVYATEPDECRKSDLGKKVETTLKARIRQETNMAKRHCRRK
jgi:hypothetical protein